MSQCSTLSETIFSLLCIGEGNSNPLQCSCLENPRDRGTCWAANHGVAEGQTRLSEFTFTHWRRKWQPTPVFLPGESQGRGSLLGCRLWGRTESDTTERLHFHFSLSLFTFTHWRRKWQPIPVFLPGESQGQGNLMGFHLWGRMESDTTKAT